MLYSNIYKQKGAKKSRPTRARELKHDFAAAIIGPSESRPTRARELKLFDGTDEFTSEVAPHAGA